VVVSTAFLKRRKLVPPKITPNASLARELTDLKYLLSLRLEFRMLWDALHAAYAVEGDENLFVLMTQVAIEGAKVNDLILFEMKRLANSG
jgi:hypothetical protein